MKARFRVQESFTITDRGLVVAGDILEGAVRTGMRAHVSHPSLGTLDLEVRAVDFVDHGGGKAEVGLVLGEGFPDCGLPEWFSQSGLVLELED